jgi:hypothetical protein
MKLDLASGQNCRDGFEGVDCYACEGVKWKVDLVTGERWPWADSSVDELHCSHFIEHIPAEFITYGSGHRRKDALFFFFDEAFRIIKPGGLFTIIWPNLKNVAAFQDPTHRRFLPLEFTHYLSREGREAMRVSHYNADCNWLAEGEVKVIQSEHEGHKQTGLWDRVFSFEVKLKAVK